RAHGLTTVRGERRAGLAPLPAPAAGTIFRLFVFRSPDSFFLRGPAPSRGSFMALPISRRQMELLNAFRTFTQAHGHTPSVRELAKILDRAASTIHQTLSTLARK